MKNASSPKKHKDNKGPKSPHRPTPQQRTLPQAQPQPQPPPPQQQRKREVHTERQRERHK